MLIEPEDLKKLVAETVKAALDERAAEKPKPSEPDPVAVAAALDAEVASMPPDEYSRRRAAGWTPGDVAPSAPSTSNK